MSTKTKPEAEVQIGKVLFLCRNTNDQIREDSIKLLDDFWQNSKKAKECWGNDIWCTYHPYELIERNRGGSDPLNQYNTIGIKWKITGRAFYIKRNFRNPKKAFKRHPNVKSVPKRKRGKRIFKKPTMEDL